MKNSLVFVALPLLGVGGVPSMNLTFSQCLLPILQILCQISARNIKIFNSLVKDSYRYLLR